jgi:hypothetical protein
MGLGETSKLQESTLQKKVLFRYTNTALRHGLVVRLSIGWIRNSFY